MVDEVVVLAVGEVVHVLHTHDRGDATRLGDLLRGDVADAEVADQAVLLEGGECFERLGDRVRPGALGVAHAHVDQVEGLDTEGVEVLVYLLAQVFGAPGRGPAALRVAGRAHLGGDEQRLRVGCSASRISPFVTRGP